MDMDLRIEIGGRRHKEWRTGTFKERRSAI